MNKRKKNISILFVSDERKEPVSFKLSLGLFKSIIFGIGVLCLLIIAGGVYYINVIEILADYDNMKEKNARIEQYKKMIYRIQKKFETIESTDKRIRKLFGEKLNGENQTDINKNMKEENDEFMKLISENDNFSFDLDSDNLLTLKKFSSSSRYIPYLIPVEGFITKEFRKNDLLTGETHTGIDIVAKEGSMIRAVADGVVIFANWTYEGGNVVIIDHLNGFSSFYKHNKRLLVKEKEFVRRGQSIALMGNSGVSSGTHLHFEIWKNGKPVDPKDYIINL